VSALALDITHFGCPQCSSELEPGGEVGAHCGRCGWTGQAMLYRPVALQVEPAREALPEDAVCAHHPTKRAEAECAGSGDYICDLCSIRIEGLTYSAQYLEAGGKNKIAKAFERYLQRPDGTVVLFMLLCFLPYVNVLWLLGMPAWIPIGYSYLGKARRLRQQDALYARIVSPGRIVWLSVIFTLFALFMLLAVVGIAVAIIVEI
jgi:hypothetical protein